MSNKPTYEELEKRIVELEQAENERTYLKKKLKICKARLEAFWSVSSLAGADTKTISNHILKMICKMTRSQYGFYGFINEYESAMTIYSWSGNAMKDCKMVTKPTIFPISEAGIWGEAIRQRKPLVLNDYQSTHPAKKGLPNGHVQLTNLLVVPFMCDEQIICVAAVANKASDYGENDIKQMKTFISGIRAIVDAKRIQEKLENEQSILQSVINGAKNSHLVYLDREFNFIRVNEAYAETCGYSPEEMIGKNHFALYPHAENKAIFSKVRDTGERFEVHDKPFEFPDQPERGTTYWDWTLTPVKDNYGDVTGLVFSLFETTDRKKAEEALLQEKDNLHKALAEIQTLRGILPICSHCKKIRDDQGDWTQIESYIHDHSKADFSHSICPECAQKYYPDMELYDEDDTCD